MTVYVGGCLFPCFLHALGDAVTELGRLGRWLQAGFVRAYAAIILVGALILIGLFAYFGFPLAR